MANYRDTVKPWFETGKRPDQNQFFAFFDWTWFKDEKIPADKIEDLQGLLDEKADQEFVENLLTTNRIIPNGNFQIFKAPGNYDNTSLEINDYVKGIVEGYIIEGLYKTGAGDQLTDFEILTEQQLYI